MKDNNRFRLGFILIMSTGLVLLYSNMNVIGYLLTTTQVIHYQLPDQLLPNYITIPMSIPFIVGFCLFFRTDEPELTDVNAQRSRS